MSPADSSSPASEYLPIASGYDCLPVHLQPTDAIEFCRFELHNESLWKAMSQEAIKSVCGPGILVSSLHGATSLSC